MTLLLEAHNVCIQYPQSRGLLERLRHAPAKLDAVIDVSISVARGQTLAVVGESGSGKTSLARALMGLVPVADGSISVEGRKLSDAAGEERHAMRRRMAMIFQDPIASLSPRMRVGTLLEEPFVIHGIRPADGIAARVRQLLDLVGLPADFADRYPHELSGGQARRVGVARALALDPSLVIADEPTAGLDVSVQGEILNLLADLQERLGLTYLVITHNLSVVRHISDQVAVLYMGRLVELAATADIFARPAHPYTRGLVDAEPRPDPDRRRERVELAGEVPSLRRRPDGCEFRTRCALARDICREKAPSLASKGGRLVSCHFSGG